MVSHSDSEGEIVESDIEKATTALPSANDTSVNRKLRDAFSPSPVPLSPSPSATGRSRDRSRSPFRARSPFRPERSPRGEKRRRPDDFARDGAQADPRRFKVHYEEGPGQRGDRRQNGSHYDDLDRERSYKSHRSYYDDRGGSDRSRDKMPHTSSRSPGRSGRVQNRFDRGEIDSKGGRDHPHSRGDRNSYAHGASYRVSFVEQSVSDRGSGPVSDAQRMIQEAESGSTMSQQHTSASTSDTHGQRSGTARLDITASVSAPVSEELSVEERRKRRDAIKAKYKTQNSPLLVQALQSGITPGSPASPTESAGATLSRSVSPVPSSPRTPDADFTQGSPPPIDVSDDAELANGLGMSESRGADEPSAADYDPTMDMQEDKARHNHRQHIEDVSASAYNKAAMEGKKDVLLPLHNVVEIPAQKLKPEDDMFASDDEDDMFAPPNPSPANGEPSQSISAPKAKTLDMSMLDNWDDHEGYYKIILGELIAGRYHVQANLGKGMFSSVVRAQDSQTDRLVAIKIIRNNETMLKAASKEMEILEKLADADPEDKKHLIRLERSFTHKGHLCMVFEHLSINLREVLKKFGRDIGINLKAVRSYAQQTFLGLSLLRKCNILHADLKPDNILVNEARNMLKICDLGSAADASENEITPYLVSRFYRAPEIILGIPYDFAIDMWSIGCTLFELYTGKILFTGRSNNQMLRNIMECRGKFSLKMLKKAEFGAVHFDDNNLHFRSVERDRLTGRDVTKLINFVKPTRDLKSRLLAGANAGPSKIAMKEAELKEVNLFLDLLERCLNLNPEKRITPSEALKHPFIHRAVPGPGLVTKPR